MYLLLLPAEGWETLQIVSILELQNDPLAIFILYFFLRLVIFVSVLNTLKDVAQESNRWMLGNFDITCLSLATQL